MHSSKVNFQKYIKWNKNFFCIYFPVRKSYSTFYFIFEIHLELSFLTTLTIQFLACILRQIKWPRCIWILIDHGCYVCPRWYHVWETQQEQVCICGVVHEQQMCAWKACEKRGNGGVHMWVIGDWGREIEGLDRDWPVHQIVRSGSKHAWDLYRFPVGFTVFEQAVLSSMLPGVSQHRWSLLQPCCRWRYNIYILENGSRFRTEHWNSSKE